ncbi:hypothetical protein [Williamwhitmania taraxaci]|uniref:Bacteriophage CI repressor helix-turn-helix domain-containing protein n=1 Tax=Williamwhitmania taraxaci TaxID=1640674 RepID=A0A1G6ME75_9BACT|nr:hypothetical protein [Williamwhitmania taraxaci]SDC53872.1 hypothetical protein SAMN05216323_103556 [Williamwhitmania taraxaci]
MTIQDRFRLIINDLYSGNKRAFAKSIGVAATVIENVVGSRKGNPSFEVIQKIIFANANIDPRWLLTGEGKMLFGIVASESSVNTNESSNKQNIVYKELLADREKKIEEKEAELREAYKEIGRLESTIDQLKKDNPSARHCATPTSQLSKEKHR